MSWIGWSGPASEPTPGMAPPGHGPQGVGQRSPHPDVVTRSMAASSEATAGWFQVMVNSTSVAGEDYARSGRFVF